MSAAVSKVPEAFKKLEPEEVVSRLTQLPRPLSSKLSIPYRGGTLADAFLWVLTAGELTRARWQAERGCKEVLGPDAKVGSLAYEEEYEQQKSYQIVQLAVRQAADPRFPLFHTVDLVRDNMTDDEISVVCQAYKQFRIQSGPIISEMMPEEMEAIIELLRGGFDRLPLSRLSGEALIDLILYLVSKLPTSATATSSPGSPPDAASTTTAPLETQTAEQPEPDRT